MLLHTSVSLDFVSRTMMLTLSTSRPNKKNDGGWKRRCESSVKRVGQWGRGWRVLAVLLRLYEAMGYLCLACEFPGSAHRMGLYWCCFLV
jgi:hypothetical protein